jgi:phosphatidylserine synthase 2
MQVLVDKFRPNVWTRYDWSMFKNLKRYNQILFFCFFCLSIDCMNFFLKFILWIPADHKILMVRVAMWAFGSIASAKEYYEFISNKNCKRVGPFVWLLSFAIGVELSIVIKFGSSMFTEPFPWYVVLMWTFIFGLILFGQGLAFYNQLNKKKQETEESEGYNLQDPAIDIEPVYDNKKNK